MLVANRADDRREGRHLRLREAGGRLVEQHEARLGRERPGNAEPALVAVRERRRRARRVTGKTQPAEQRVRAPVASPGDRADAERRHLDVLADRERAERMAVLERAREPVRGRAAAATSA